LTCVSARVTVTGDRPHSATSFRAARPIAADATQEDPLSQPTTAVIGAGISGLTTSKMLSDYGLPFTTFEVSDRIGGNWAFGNPNGHGSYRSLHIDTSKYLLSFGTSPCPRSTRTSRTTP